MVEYKTYPKIATYILWPLDTTTKLYSNYLYILSAMTEHVRRNNDFFHSLHIKKSCRPRQFTFGSHH